MALLNGKVAIIIVSTRLVALLHQLVRNKAVIMAVVMFKRKVFALIVVQSALTSRLVSKLRLTLTSPTWSLYSESASAYSGMTARCG